MFSAIVIELIDVVWGTFMWLLKPEERVGLCQRMIPKGRQMRIT